ncbi:unnamed protein product [Alternaria alternata]
MQDKKKQTQYYSHMSKAFASMCHVFATVMDKSIGLDAATVNDVNQNGLWFHAEFPTLQRLKQVTMIEAISEDGGKRFTYWTSLNMFATSAQHEDVVDDSPKRADTLDFDWDQSTADDIFVEEWDTGTETENKLEVSSYIKQFSYGLINLEGKVSEAFVANVMRINAN